MNNFSITANLVDIPAEKIYPVEITVENGRIRSVQAINPSASEPLPYVLPGLIDAHVHIESSMLVPSEFARLAVVHGTVATVSDPHEIGNVLGVKGVEFMIENGRKTPFKFYFGAPSCVPATAFETAGAAISADEVDTLLQRPEIKYLSEMMNFPGVLNGDREVMKKLQAARKYQKPADGHAPGLRGEAAKKYIEAGLPEGNTGISTDHECFTPEEALDKLQYGMKIIIREGSAARNFEALIGLLNDYPNRIMFCSDDKHPDSLVEGHINLLVKRALARGIDLFKVLRAACVNPVSHYALDVGLLREGDPADFIMVSNLEDFTILRTYIGGELVAENGTTRIASVPVGPINHFNCRAKNPGDFAVPLFPQGINSGRRSGIVVIEALDGQLVTNKLMEDPLVENDRIIADTSRDILKLAVVNRYQDAPPAIAFIKNLGLRSGAIASSVAHDSHNIIAVGADDESICEAVNLLIEQQGGISVVGDRERLVLPLPVAGIMTTDDGYAVARKYAELDRAAKSLGSTLRAPFMTLSFMALLVIPHLKLSDKGLFDGDRFELVN